MKLWALILAALILCTANSKSTAQVVETSKGKVEFIGLEHWTPKMIQDELGYKSPDDFHFCASDLKSKLKFVDTSVVADREEGRRYTIITVIEPARAGDVRYRPAPTASVPVPGEWRDLVRLIEQKKVLNGLLDYGSTLRNASLVDGPSISAGEDTSWWKLLRQRRSRKDYERALKILAGDKDFQNRAAAAMVLTNFAEHDASWLALMKGVRDENLFVNSACVQALITLTKYVPRRINWSPAAPDINYILRGTNLYALPHVLKTLLKTGVSKHLAKPLLQDGGERILLAYLRAQHKTERGLAHDLLVQLSGQDFGFDDLRWAAWISSVRR